MAAALSGLRQAGRCENLARKFGGRALIDESNTAVSQLGQDLVPRGTDADIGILGTVVARLRTWHVGARLTPFVQPLLPAAIHETSIFMSIDLQQPECIGGKPVVVVAVEYNGVAVANPRPAQKLFD